MARGAGCLNWARPDLWGPGVGNRPGLPDRGGLGLAYLLPALSGADRSGPDPGLERPVGIRVVNHVVIDLQLSRWPEVFARRLGMDAEKRPENQANPTMQMCEYIRPPT